jgi:outer membrane immunogenic protein
MRIRFFGKRCRVCLSGGRSRRRGSIGFGGEGASESGAGLFVRLGRVLPRHSRRLWLGRHHVRRTALDAKPQGGLGGVQAGYNWQFGQVVAGVEGDFSWADIKQLSVTSGILTNLQTGAQFPVAREVKFDDLATVRARLGYVIFPGVLAYATAGGAWGHSSGTFWAVGGSFSDTSTPDGFGWTAGAGIEYKLTEHVLLRGEYLHYGFSAFSYDRPHINPRTVSGATDIDVARAGPSYKF